MVRKIVWILIPVLLVSAGVLGSFYMYAKATEDEAKTDMAQTNIVIETPSPLTSAEKASSTSTSTSTSSPEDLEDISLVRISILNGSGVAGDADRAKTYLTELGYSVEEVGNAENFNFTKSQLTHHSDVDEDYITKMREELLKAYQVDIPDIDPALSEKEVVLVVGSEKVDD